MAEKKQTATDVRNVYKLEKGEVVPVEFSEKTNPEPARERVPSKEGLSEITGAALSGMGEGEKKTGELSRTAKKISAVGKFMGMANDSYSIGQHLTPGNVRGAEALTESAGAAGSMAGGVAGAEAGAVLGASGGPLSPFTIPVTSAVLGGIGAYYGSDTMKKITEQLTGGDTPDKIFPSATLPNSANIKPAITTSDGNNYGLVDIEGKYTWFAIHDNSDLMLPNRYSEILSGKKIKELNEIYAKNSVEEKAIAKKERENKERKQQEQTLQAQNKKNAEIVSNLAKNKSPTGKPMNTLLHEEGKNYKSTEIWTEDKKNKHLIGVNTLEKDGRSVSTASYYNSQTGAFIGQETAITENGKTTKSSTLPLAKPSTQVAASQTNKSSARVNIGKSSSRSNTPASTDIKKTSKDKSSSKISSKKQIDAATTTESQQYDSISKQSTPSQTSKLETAATTTATILPDTNIAPSASQTASDISKTHASNKTTIHSDLVSDTPQTARQEGQSITTPLVNIGTDTTNSTASETQNVLPKEPAPTSQKVGQPTTPVVDTSKKSTVIVAPEVPATNLERKSADRPITAKAADANAGASQPARTASKRVSEGSGADSLQQVLSQLQAALTQLGSVLSQPIQITVDVQNGNIVAAVNAANSQQQRRN
ncbi:RidA family protein [Chromobacterium violaceum]|uniref:RidA family protein n=1 Tax=Chromobacterium violaceum TaxID=536 RepID=UPI001B3320DA|nr:RidA family protein [Chromobacterium violaceum]MBP4051231.1 RidA family protein [Chromobacterium violaceum]